MSGTTQLHGGRHTSKQVNHESRESTTPSPSHVPSIQEEPPLPDPETNLNEIAAPPPIYDDSRYDLFSATCVDKLVPPWGEVVSLAVRF